MPFQSNPVYSAWINIRHFISLMVMFLILALLFYLVITPAALLLRLFDSRLLLRVKPDPNASTYWIARSEPAQSRERFAKRY